jgi:hypothetical protein
MCPSNEKMLTPHGNPENQLIGTLEFADSEVAGAVSIPDKSTGSASIV